jgi:hypothetical protein
MGESRRRLEESYPKSVLHGQPVSAERRAAIAASRKDFSKEYPDMVEVAVSLGRKDSSIGARSRALVGLLGDNDARVRQAAAISLGKAGQKNAIAPLIRAIKAHDQNTNRRVTKEAAIALKPLCFRNARKEQLAVLKYIDSSLKGVSEEKRSLIVAAVFLGKIRIKKDEIKADAAILRHHAATMDFEHLFRALDLDRV